MIYLDYNATTPIASEVADGMKQFLYGTFGNPSSNHIPGKKARSAIDYARSQVAEMIRCGPEEIIFTSGGTESNNLAIKGYAFQHSNGGNHIITSAIEHPAVLEVCRYLEAHGFIITTLSVGENGIIDLDELRDAICEKTILISIMHANNEVGTIQPIQEISKIARSHNIGFHTDAAQSIGKIPVDVANLGVDLLSVAGHKLYAPKGIGALYIRNGVLLEKQTHGANHECDLRPGTENVMGIVGLGLACELISKNLSEYAVHYAEMRDLLEMEMKKAVSGMRINGDTRLRIPNTSNIGFFSRAADKIISEIPDVAVSAGAACHAEEVTISHVLSAMNVPEVFAKGTIRFSVGRDTTREEIVSAVDMIKKAIFSFPDCL